MTGENLKKGLEGLSKIDRFSDILYIAIYWVAVVFVLLLVAYVVVTISVYLSKRKRGLLGIEDEDFLDS